MFNVHFTNLVIV